jgi:release factor glutamine methyltransferase
MTDFTTSAQTKLVSNSNRIWTITDILNWSIQYLKSKNFEDPRLNTELLICCTLNYKRIDLYTHFDKPLSAAELEKFKSLFKRRLQHEPIQYILNEAEFMGFKFFVDKRVLIPRRETELLVEEVINFANKPERRLDILDIGVGSGNIAVSLAKTIPNSFIVGIDISADALDVARINVEHNGVLHQIELIQNNIFDNLTFNHKFDIVVSNPPYISKLEIEQVSDEVSKYEPSVALTDNKDGLEYFRRIGRVSKSFLNNGGWLFVEIAYNQKHEVVKMFSDFGYSNIEAIKDYGGKFRVVKCKNVSN